MPITRADIAALIEEEYSHTLLNRATATSTVLSAFTTVPMGAKVQNMPALATRPTASFVGETAGTRTKPNTKFSFENKVLTAQEIAAIIVLNEEDLEDATDDLLANAAALGGEAVGRTLDAAVMFGDNKPAAWTSPDLFAAATAAGQVYQVGTGEDDLVGSIYQAAESVDDSGANPDAFLSRGGFKFKLANLRNADGTPIYLPSLSSAPGAVDNVAGLSAFWNKNGAWDRAKALGLVADTAAVLIGVRTDIQVKFLTEATIGGVNLAENDQVALRFRARYAYTMADVVGSDGERVSPVSAITAAPVGP
ncbi:HK97 family phage major capsid protein [Paenarthrobacter nicotinovorans]|uniref:HK97 family phage major capsid protein n=1 Tax=Paenarthrobacter nicotinovorans TaxID=29320 RepID=A0ABT9TP54_PAENI|nr:phage major capsid protein [Paenarthrobacter nicotinovorans]MDQ0102347.1 HK97 family phage major capsid protein [Paenarthrobacter nicotinovorans]